MFFEVGILKCVFWLLIDWPLPLKCILAVIKILLRSYFLVYHLNFHFVLYLRNYKEFKAESLDLQIEKYGISFDIKKCTTSGWALGDENVIGIFIFQLNSPEGGFAINSQIFIKRVTTGKNGKVYSLHVPAIG